MVLFMLLYRAVHFARCQLCVEFQFQTQRGTRRIDLTRDAPLLVGSTLYNCTATAVATRHGCTATPAAP